MPGIGQRQWSVSDGSRGRNGKRPVWRDQEWRSPCEWRFRSLSVPWYTPEQWLKPATGLVYIHVMVPASHIRLVCFSELPPLPRLVWTHIWLALLQNLVLCIRTWFICLENCIDFKSESLPVCENWPALKIAELWCIWIVPARFKPDLCVSKTTVIQLPEGALL